MSLLNKFKDIAGNVKEIGVRKFDEVKSKKELSIKKLKLIEELLEDIENINIDSLKQNLQEIKKIQLNILKEKEKYEEYLSNTKEILKEESKNLFVKKSKLE